jgi:hypothetical protein
MNATKSIAVIYENAEARQTGVAFCDALVGRFWGQFEFDVSWWSFDEFENGDSAQAAAKKASGADFVVFATRYGERVPRYFRNWIDMWLNQRGEHEGALVSLCSAGARAHFETGTMSLYLRSVAHRAGMDYLTEIPQGLSHPIPESLESCTERAQQVTSLLDEILHSPLPGAPLSLS